MKISIIIPVYNAEKYLDRCIDSLKNQSLKDIEIIFINDGSKDRSLEIIKKFASEDKRVKYIDKKNEGVSIARNIGIDNSNGEYIIFLDADDYIDSSMYEKLYKKAIEEQSDIVLCDYIRKSVKNNYTEYNKVLDTDFKCVLEDIKEEFLTKEKDGYCWNKLYKASILKKKNIKFNPKMKFCEDLYFNYDVLNNVHRASYINKGLY